MTPRLPAWVEERPFLAMLLAGAVSADGFAPLGLWPLTILSLALLLAMLARARTGRGAFVIGYGYGLGQFVVGLNWIAHAFTFQDAMPHWFGYGAVVLLSFYLAVYPAVGALLAWRLAGRGGTMALTLTMAGGWALTEYLRATLFTGFAWNPLGVIWIDTGIAPVARWIGTYGLGSLAIVAAGCLLGLVRRHWLALLPLGALSLFALASWIIGQEGSCADCGTGVRITVVQPNIDQDQKYDPMLEARNFQKLASLTGTPPPIASLPPRLITQHPALLEDMKERQRHPVYPRRFIFWPEAAVSALLDMEPEWRLRLAALLGPGDLLMTGGDKYHFRKTTGAFYSQTDLLGANNSLWVLTSDARIVGRYDKAHLVPYGEYLPMRPLLSAIGLSRLVPGDMDFWPGPGPRTLTLPYHYRTLPMPGVGRPIKMGVQICYEMIFSGQVVDRANRPDFLFNPSNDAWFGTWGPPQHLAQARLRAVEEAMPVIRSTPTGISAIVDASGRVTGAIPPGTAAALDGMLPPAAPPTFFARFGNIVPLLLAVFLIISGVALARVRR